MQLRRSVTVWEKQNCLNLRLTEPVLSYLNALLLQKSAGAKQNFFRDGVCFKIMETDTQNSQKPIRFEDTALRHKIREYAREQRKGIRTHTTDALRFGLGQIKDEISELENLSVQDVRGMAGRIKRRKQASAEDMYRLSHAFLQGNDNINEFACVPGAIQVLVKELTGK